MRQLLISAVLLVSLNVSCAQKPLDKGQAKHYQLTGKIVSLDAREQTASIDAAAIPGYMEAMTMSYPVAQKSDFESLHPGDQIKATVNVYDSGDFDLSSIEKTASSR